MHTDMWKTEGLKQALEHHRFDAAFGGPGATRRSPGPRNGSSPSAPPSTAGTPSTSAPSCGTSTTSRKNRARRIRVFPLSNWTELDVWQYIHLEQIPVVPLYFAAQRPVVERDGTLIMVDDDRMRLEPGEPPAEQRALPDARLLPADRRHRERGRHAAAIIEEMMIATTSERQGRVIDHDSAASMEQKKQEGYF